MRGIDFTSWHGLITTVIGLAFVSLLGVGIRLMLMMSIQQRRERTNRQINERLKTLIAAYKTLGGSFTGDLAVDPAHRRDATRLDEATQAASPALPAAAASGSDRTRRIRDAVEAALSDIILLGTEDHVRLAERAARDLVAGRAVHTDELVVALRNFIRRSLNLDAVPPGLQIPPQGPTRPSGSSGKGGKDQAGGRTGGGGGGGGGLGGGGGGMGGTGNTDDAETDAHHSA